MWNDKEEVQYEQSTRVLNVMTTDYLKSHTDLDVLSHLSH